METKRFRKTMALLMALCIGSSMLGGCGNQSTAGTAENQKTEAESGNR